MLSRMPGVTAKNIDRIMRSVRDLRALSEMALRPLQRLIGRDDGRKLFNFLNTK
jgi:DNA excision repair protein ERCC-4